MSEKEMKKAASSGIFAKAKAFFKGVKSEFKKITWPDRASMLKQTAAVIVVSFVVGVIIAILDFFLQYGINFLLSI